MPTMSHENFLKIIRARELESALQHFPSPDNGVTGRTLLEIGAGTGQQARMLASLGYYVTAIDLSTSHYRNQRVFDVIEYDGRVIPCATGSMEIVFSSNVLEHVGAIDDFLRETVRAMAENGVAIHILPTSSCRTWSLLAHYIWAVRRLLVLSSQPSGITELAVHAPKRPSGFSEWMATLFPARHGERGTPLTESFYYSEYWWKNRFNANGLQVESIHGNKIFYSMANALTDRISLERRIKLSRYLGSSCKIYVLRKMPLKMKATT